MFSIRKHFIEKGISSSDIDSLEIDNDFCYKHICSDNSKCQNFYKNFFQQLGVQKYLVCPYGYVCYCPSENTEAILCGAVCELSDLRQLRTRWKGGKKDKEQIFKSSKAFEKFDYYNNYIFYVSICHSVCHDLNNALVYFIDLYDALEKNETTLFFHNEYDKVIEAVKKIQNEAIYIPFDIGGHYYIETLQTELIDLYNNIWEISKKADKKLKNIDCDLENDLFCYLAGFSLIKTLLRRHLMISNIYNFKETAQEFSLHKIVRKIASLLKYKANDKRVTFSEFEGSPNCVINNYQEDVFTAIFTVVDNSIKYATICTDVAISFREQEDNNLVLEIQNNSLPLTDYDLEHIHDKGYRGSNKSKKGQGLGLYLVNEICKSRNIRNKAKYKSGIFTYSFIFSK